MEADPSKTSIASVEQPGAAGIAVAFAVSAVAKVKMGKTRIVLVCHWHDQQINA